MDCAGLDGKSSAAGRRNQSENREGWRLQAVTLLSLPYSLSRVQLHDERFLDVGAELVAVGRLLEDAFELGRVDLHPVGQALAGGQLDRIGDAQLRLRLVA